MTLAPRRSPVLVMPPHRRSVLLVDTPRWETYIMARLDAFSAHALRKYASYRVMTVPDANTDTRIHASIACRSSRSISLEILTKRDITREAYC